MSRAPVPNEGPDDASLESRGAVAGLPLSSNDSRAEPAWGHRRRFLRRVALALGAAGTYSGFLRGFQADAATSRIHVVRPGDTLSEIAERHSISVERLRNLNGIESDVIQPGQRLRLSGEAEYPLLRPVRAEIARADLSRRRWRHIILHHSATPAGNARIFDRYHRERRRMENGLAYHFIIGNGSDSGDGEVEVGSRWVNQLQGGHVRSFAYNENSVGICLVGDFQRTRPTPRQIAVCLELVEYIKKNLLGGQAALMLHRELKGEHTVCPGRYFPTLKFRSLRA